MSAAGKSPGRTRTLIVDDSAFARKVLREVLSSDPRIDVVGFARDGLDALEKIEELSPDVITLDLMMPELDGAGVLEALRSHPRPPRAILVTMNEASSSVAVRALQAGAFDIVHKPTALATDRLYELRDELVRKVLAAGAASAGSTRPIPPRPRARGVVAVGGERTAGTRIVVIGTSTGGPRALTALLTALPPTFPVPIAAVVHMPPGFTLGLARRLDKDTELTVTEAEEGAVVGPGAVAIGRAGAHLRVLERHQRCLLHVGGGPAASLHQPSVDVLFASAAKAFGKGVIGVVLTGMGTDGLEGAAEIRAAGGRILVEDASTCVVHGMPRVVAEAGLADAVVPLDGMAEAIASRL